MNKRIRKKKEKQAWERMQALPVPELKPEDMHVFLCDPFPGWFDRQYAAFNPNYGVAQQKVQGSAYEIVRQFMTEYADRWSQGTPS